MSNLRYLKTFVAVAEQGSFSAAADRVALTPAAVGLQMRALEQDLRLQLFDRSRRVVTLTAQGRAILPHARKLITDYQKLIAASLDHDSIRGSVTIGATVSTVGLLASSLVELKTLYPALDIKLILGHTLNLPTQIKAGELDAGILMQNSRHYPPGMHWTLFYEEPLVLIASSQVATPDTDPFDLLRSQPFIRFDQGTATGTKIAGILKRRQIDTHDILEINSLMTIAELVRQNAGVTIAPLLHNAGWDRDDALCVLPLPGRHTRKIGWLENDDRLHVTSVIRQHLHDKSMAAR